MILSNDNINDYTNVLHVMMVDNDRQNFVFICKFNTNEDNIQQNLD